MNYLAIWEKLLLRHKPLLLTIDDSEASRHMELLYLLP